jgi:hypothetical protein
MNSQDRLWAIVVIWLVFGLMVGIMCNVGGTQAEEVVLSLFLGIFVLAATMHLSDAEAAQRLLRRQPADKSKHEGEPNRLLDVVTDEELDVLRGRLAEKGQAESAISTLSPPFDR